jgi:hypothetical protein
VDEVADAMLGVALCLGPDRDDLAGDLVAEDPRRLDAAVAVVEDADVGAADAAGDDAQERPVRRAGRLADLSQLHRSGPGPDARPHAHPQQDV